MYLFNPPETIVRIRQTLILTLSLAIGTIYAGEPQNIRTTVFDVDAVGSDIVSTTYSDGLGRTLQKQTAVSSMENLVTSTIYDAAGRADTVVLPFVHTYGQAANAFIPNGDALNSWVNRAKSYYTNVYSPQYPAEVVGITPFSRTAYDDDPLSRPRETSVPGDTFAINGPFGQHTTKTWYFGVTGGADPALYFSMHGFIQTD
jgi:hypothetical protein